MASTNTNQKKRKAGSTAEEESVTPLTKRRRVSASDNKDDSNDATMSDNNEQQTSNNVDATMNENKQQQISNKVEASASGTTEQTTEITLAQEKRCELLEAELTRSRVSLEVELNKSASIKNQLIELQEKHQKCMQELEHANEEREQMYQHQATCEAEGKKYKLLQAEVQHKEIAHKRRINQVETNLRNAQAGEESRAQHLRQLEKQWTVTKGNLTEQLAATEKRREAAEHAASVNDDRAKKAEYELANAAKKVAYTEDQLTTATTRMELALEHVKRVERECEKFKKDLALAKHRIRTLEQQFQQFNIKEREIVDVLRFADKNYAVPKFSHKLPESDAAQYYVHANMARIRFDMEGSTLAAMLDRVNGPKLAQLMRAGNNPTVQSSGRAIHTMGMRTVKAHELVHAAIRFPVHTDAEHISTIMKKETGMAVSYIEIISTAKHADEELMKGIRIDFVPNREDMALLYVPTQTEMVVQPFRTSSNKDPRPFRVNEVKRGGQLIVLTSAHCSIAFGRHGIDVVADVDDDDDVNIDRDESNDDTVDVDIAIVMMVDKDDKDTMDVVNGITQAVLPQQRKPACSHDFLLHSTPRQPKNNRNNNSRSARGRGRGRGQGRGRGGRKGWPLQNNRNSGNW